MSPGGTISIAWALLGFATTFAAEAPADKSRLLVTNCISVLRMSSEEANRNHPVKLSARVTCFVPTSQLCFVQDSSAGVYVLPSRWPRDLAPGDLVEIEGETGSGRFSSIVLSAGIKSLGRKEPIEAAPVSIEELNTGRHDSQVVQLEGVVQNVTAGPDNATLELGTGASTASILVFGGAPALTNLVDAKVRARGVAGTFYSGDRLTGFGLFANASEDIEVLQPPIAPFSAPLRPMDRLHVFSLEGGADHRIRVQGAVTVVWPGEAFFIQEGSRAMFVIPSAGPPPAPGDLVEVSGFVPPLRHKREISNAVFRKIGSRQISAARLVPEAVLSNSPPLLVALEGSVLRTENRPGSSSLTIDAGGHFVVGYIPRFLSPIAPGSRVRVTGAWNEPPAAWGERSSPGLWLNASNSIEVLAPPPEPAAARKDSFPALAVAGAALWALAATGAAWRTARTARAKARELQSARERASDCEHELEVLQESRERLGRDLHDSAIQAIYAVGLNLDDCAQQLRTNPERVESRLKSAMGDINGVIRELRNVILGLETTAIQPKEFRTALKSLSLALGHEKSNRMRLDIDQTAVELLSPIHATELIHIAREALSNSLRHGQAATTTFSLRVVDDNLRFVIEDDGRGFDPATAQNQGFGLRNMAKRTENLGAKFTVSSQPGQGARIVLDIPRQKQHFSASEPDPRSHR